MDVPIEIGVPAEPKPEAVTENIARILRDHPEVAFAYLPEIFIPDRMDSPQQVLMLITEVNGDGLEELLNAISKDIRGKIPDEDIPQLYPVSPKSKLVPVAISTGCLVEINDHLVFEKCQE